MGLNTRGLPQPSWSTSTRNSKKREWTHAFPGWATDVCGSNFTDGQLKSVYLKVAERLLDIVTRIPARLMGYSHVGTFVYISESGDLSHDVGFWYQFMDSITGIIHSIGEQRLDSIEDHCMDNYIAAIRKWGPQPPTD